jgi:hypothetical protein
MLQMEAGSVLVRFAERQRLGFAKGARDGITP